MSDRNPEEKSHSAQLLKEQLMKTMKRAYNNGVSLTIPNPIWNTNIGHYLPNNMNNIHIESMKASENKNESKNKSNGVVSRFDRMRSISMTMTIPVPSYNISNSQIYSKYKNYEKSFFKQLSKDYDYCHSRINEQFGKYNIRNPFPNINNNNNISNNNCNGNNRHLIEIEIGWNLDYFF